MLSLEPLSELVRLSGGLSSTSAEFCCAAESLAWFRASFELDVKMKCTIMYNVHVHVGSHMYLS